MREQRSCCSSGCRSWVEFVKRLAFANLKGGVGKSTTTLIAAETLALQGENVLVLDLDPQANCSYMLLSAEGVNQAELANKTLPHFLLALREDSGEPPASFITIKASDLSELDRPPGLLTGRIDVLPSIPRMWIVEFEYTKRLFQNDKDPVETLRHALDKGLNSLSGSYSVVLVDCPPGFSVLTQAGLLLAEAIISPTIADEVSMRSLKDFVELGVRGLLANKATDRHHVVVSKFRSDKVSAQSLRSLKQDYDVLDPPIRYSNAMPKAAYRINLSARRTFASKYGPLQADVRMLGDRIYRYIVKR